jgi:hypothetical protein
MAAAGMELTPAQVREAFPGWTVHEAQDGRWWARRPGTVTPYGPESLLRRVLVAGTLGGLAEQLCVQAALDALTEEELVTVWREARFPSPAGGIAL